MFEIQQYFLCVSQQYLQESSSGTDWRSIKPQTHPYSSIKQLSWQRSFETGLEATSVSDPNSTAVGSTTSKPSAEVRRHFLYPKNINSPLDEIANDTHHIGGQLSPEAIVCGGFFNSG